MCLRLVGRGSCKSDHADRFEAYLVASFAFTFHSSLLLGQATAMKGIAWHRLGIRSFQTEFAFRWQLSRHSFESHGDSGQDFDLCPYQFDSIN